ncbi:MAG: glutamine--fructose-6-phosphate transaminase (isomerizing) [Treponema sp.]|jgi:glucosamine--fructose-6-phosphate aminotransferase (isomerizing)|nr:glutamine--fructose-6-phosphate transaminase (isomerizing) [Treponema sp.]
MCGIVGYIGGKEALPVLLNGLKRLEYRGYDSAGIALFGPAGITVHKSKGRIRELEEKISTEKLPGMVGIGHTRWATHGEPSDINSHPQTDAEGRVAVVHNGIIENYGRLKEWLISKGLRFKSETDTEVVANLINFYYKDDILSAVREAVKRLQGSYALGIIAAGESDRIIAVRKESPLVVGLGKGENLIASDVPALLEYTREVYYLEDGEIAALYRDHTEVYNGEGQAVEKEASLIQWDAAAAERGGFEHFMLKEIHEQPRALTDTLRPRIRTNIGAGASINLEEIGFNDSWAGGKAGRVVITACGTAWHAGVIGKYAFERYAGIPVDVDTASEFRYRNPVFDPKDIFIVISQSGETADTLAAMRLAKQGGAKIIAITNVVGSTLAREADLVMYTWAGPEIAVASTKAFTTQLVCLYLIALKFGVLRGRIQGADMAKYIEALEAIPAHAETILSGKANIQRFASLQFNKNKVFFMGRLFDYAACLESALKLKEISYAHSEAFAAGEIKHGPIALVDTSTLIVALCTQSSLFDKMESSITQVKARGAAAAVITWEDCTRFDSIADEVFRIPKTEEGFSPILSVIPAQLFAYYCSVLRGLDPDKPRNLAKSVTVE